MSDYVSYWNLDIVIYNLDNLRLEFYFTTKEKEIYNNKNICPRYKKELMLESTSTPAPVWFFFVSVLFY